MSELTLAALLSLVPLTLWMWNLPQMFMLATGCSRGRVLTFAAYLVLHALICFTVCALAMLAAFAVVSGLQ